MKVIGISGLENSVTFKQTTWPGLAPEEYRIAQGMDAAAALVIAGRRCGNGSAERSIQPKGLRIPLFGTRLATYLGPDQPFYALQSPLESQAEPRESSVEELAVIYIEELQKFFPKGPYLLGGASLGGLIALEMSRQLYAQGTEPGLLILFDTVVPGSDHRLAARHQISEHWRKFRERGAPHTWRKK